MIQLRRFLSIKPAPEPWRPTHQHRKGGLYRLIQRGIYESDRSPVAIYDDADGTVWVRPWAEFQDGRFKEVQPSHQEIDQ